MTLVVLGPRMTIIIPCALGGSLSGEQQEQHGIHLVDLKTALIADRLSVAPPGECKTFDWVA
jgi:hypothetical protein